MPISGNTTQSNVTSTTPSGNASTASTSRRTELPTGTTGASGTLNRAASRHFRPGDTRTGPRLQRTPSTLTIEQRERLLRKLRRQQEEATQARHGLQPAGNPVSAHPQDATSSAPQQPQAWFDAYDEAARAEGFVFVAVDKLRDRSVPPKTGMWVWVVIEDFEDTARHLAFANWVSRHPELHDDFDLQVQRPIGASEAQAPDPAYLGYPEGRFVRLWREPLARLEAAAIKLLMAAPGADAKIEYVKSGGIASSAAKAYVKTLSQAARSDLGRHLNDFQDALEEQSATHSQPAFVPSSPMPSTKSLHYLVVPGRYMPHVLAHVDWSSQAVLRIDPSPGEEAPPGRKLTLDKRHEKLEL